MIQETWVLLGDVYLNLDTVSMIEIKDGKAPNFKNVTFTLPSGKEHKVVLDDETVNAITIQLPMVTINKER